MKITPFVPFLKHKRIPYRNWLDGANIMPKSPLELEREQLPRGDAKWPGYDHVWTKIQNACIKMGLSKTHHLSDLHISSMAILGTGHEETMKYQMALLASEGWI